MCIRTATFSIITCQQTTTMPSAPTITGIITPDATRMNATAENTAYTDIPTTMHHGAATSAPTHETEDKHGLTAMTTDSTTTALGIRATTTATTTITSTY